MDPNILMSLFQSPGPGIDVGGTDGLPSWAQVPPPTNVLQTATPPVAPQPAPQAPPAVPAEKPRQRRSLLDTVGRISDVLARVGGAEALYQPTLDSREDRARQLDTGNMQRTLLQQQIGQGEDENVTRDNALVGQAVRGLQAIQRRGGDINQAWPLLARQAGIPEERAAQLGQIFATNPEAVAGIATIMSNQQQEFGVQPFYAQDADGNVRAYQLGRDGTVRPIELGEGMSPIDPLSFVDTGGAMVGVGQRSGRPRRILPRTERPGAAIERGTRVQIAREGIGSRERIAGADRESRERIAAGRSGAGGANAAMAETARGNLNELRTIYRQLNEMGAMVSPGRSTGGNVTARLRASAVGQTLEGAVGTQAQTLRDRVASIRPGLMQSIARATGMTARQLDSNADVRLFMQTVTNPASSYEANLAAIAGLERFLAASTRARPAATPNPTPRATTPRRRITPSTGGGWGRATVVGR